MADGSRCCRTSQGTTQMDGAISAKGGPKGGDGGFVDTSGRMLGVGNSAAIDVGAQVPVGKPGTWLLDPFDITIGTEKQNTATTAAARSLPAGIPQRCATRRCRVRLTTRV